MRLTAYPKAYAVWPTRRLCRQLALGASWLCCCRSNEHCWRFERVESPRFEQVEALVGGRERSSTWRSASGSPCVPKGAVPHPEGGALLPERSWQAACATAAFCSRRSPYTALAARWHSSREHLVFPKEHRWRFAKANRLSLRGETHETEVRAALGMANPCRSHRPAQRDDSRDIVSII